MWINIPFFINYCFGIIEGGLECNQRIIPIHIIQKKGLRYQRSQAIAYPEDPGFDFMASRGVEARLTDKAPDIFLFSHFS